jgi:hypothetical protein
MLALQNYSQYYPENTIRRRKCFAKAEAACVEGTGKVIARICVDDLLSGVCKRLLQEVESRGRVDGAPVKERKELGRVAEEVGYVKAIESVAARICRGRYFGGYG